MVDFVCCITGGVHSTSPLLDLTTLEENDLPNVTVAVLPRTKRVTLVSMETRLHVERFEELFKLCAQAGGVLFKEMKLSVDGWTKKLVGAMSVGPKLAIPGNESADKDVVMDETYDY